eukprot:TRINITY_DN12134_c0_g2_i1.p1 TRINITY_DN12134_c0_g2~~TRINITY_DN12134_c0_g2_i1.p1  ORF type:complete len:288 (-),score=69.71 TRINITY_DN12134_c0_g2_i1:37-900(-)
MTICKTPEDEEQKPSHSLYSRGIPHGSWKPIHCQPPLPYFDPDHHPALSSQDFSLHIFGRQGNDLCLLTYSPSEDHLTFPLDNRKEYFSNYFYSDRGSSSAKMGSSQCFIHFLQNSTFVQTSLSWKEGKEVCEVSGKRRVVSWVMRMMYGFPKVLDGLSTGEWLMWMECCDFFDVKEQSGLVPRGMDLEIPEEEFENLLSYTHLGTRIKGFIVQVLFSRPQLAKLFREEQLKEMINQILDLDKKTKLLLSILPYHSNSQLLCCYARPLHEFLSKQHFQHPPLLQRHV